jgi:hypothetical protein
VGSRCGVLYVATGDRYVTLASRSARSVRRTSASLAIHLCSDSAGLAMAEQRADHPFTSFSGLERVHRRSRLDVLAETPFDRTLFLDADTEVRASVEPVFALLDRFDIALAHAHRRNHPDTLQTWRADVPSAFPQFNAGVMAFRRTDAVIAFLREWARAFHAAGFPKDQVTLRELLWASDLRIATLPPEFNVRYRKYLFLWRHDEAIPKILHLAGWPSLTRAVIGRIRARDGSRRALRRLKRGSGK